MHQRTGSAWAVVAAVSVLVVAPMWPVAAQEVDLDQLRARALELVNDTRREHGLQPLSMGEDLEAAAQAHATDMERRAYYAHETPEGETPRDRFLAAGGSEWELVAENIARCGGCPLPPDDQRVQAFHSGWMNSPEHRANILREGVTRFGFGLAADPDGTIYGVQDFAGPGEARSVGDPHDRDVLATGEANRIAQDLINEARRDAGVPALNVSETLAAAAEGLVPETLEDVDLDAIGDPTERLPGDWAASWQSIGSVAGACGGCGTETTWGDVRAFITDWLQVEAYRKSLLNREMTDFGLAIRSDGKGKKVALALLGASRP